MSSMLTLAAAVPSFVKRSRADGETYAGPYWVFITALGAWDPRFLFDPVSDATQNRITTQIAKIGNISYAPIPVDLTAFGLDTSYDYGQYLLSNEQFLQRYGSRLLVINGIDTSTNNHETGQRAAQSGMNPEGYPALGALIAASRGASQPIAFMSSGGYDRTAGLVPLARVSDPDALRNVAAPNVIDPKNADSSTFHTTDTWARIQKVRQDRLIALEAGQRLPRVSRAMSGLEAARATEPLLAHIPNPSTLVSIPGYQLDDLERFEQQVQLTVAGFSAGLTVSSSLQIGGFDTHGNHDRDQPRQITKLWGGVDYLMQQLAAAGLADRTFVVIASDFGRGPQYNGTSTGAGKDHWPITSMLMMGPGIAGDRVIGATTPDQLAARVDPSNPSVPADDGISITPASIHHALRQLAGISSELDGKYPLPGNAAPLFG